MLGAGIMGAPMARNAAAAGLDVRIWNRSADKAKALADHGVSVAATPAEAIAGAQLVVTMLADGGAVADVLDDQALAALDADAIWIQASTVGIEATVRLRERAAEHGVAYVDAPMLGTRTPAEDGQLVVLASGPVELQERCAPFFDAVGSRTLWLGEAGAGTRMKLVVNGWLLALTAALGESIALARALDVDPADFLELLDGAPMDSPYAQLKGKAILAEDFTPSFPTRLAGKDARLVVEAGEGVGLDLELSRTVMSLFERAAALGHGDEDMAAVVKASDL